MASRMGQGYVLAAPTIAARKSMVLVAFALPLLSQWSRKPLDARQKKISVQTDRDQMEYLSTKVWLDGHSRFRETGI